MKYVLKNKDIKILEFSSEFKDDINTISNIVVFHKEMLPLNLPRIKKLENWIRQRRIPRDRKNAVVLLSLIGADNLNNLMAYIDVSFGLSLNDSYWIIPADKEYKWNDYNLYHNDFSKAFQLAAFGFYPDQSDCSPSPELTTNGMLKKCWYRDKGQIFLYKSSGQKREAFAEYYNWQIAELMGINSVRYDLVKHNDEIICKSKLFTSEDIGFVPAGYLIGKKYKIKESEQLCGKEFFEDMMVFDALIGNIDRHTGNYGVLIDNNLNKIICPAPLFDNGLGILGWYDETQSDMQTQLNRSISAFDKTFDNQLEQYIRPRHTEALEWLQDFEFIRHDKYNIDEKILTEFEEILHQRVSKVLEKYQTYRPGL